MAELDIRNCDNMDLMREFPDNHFNLAIVDPPYGLGYGTYARTNKLSTGERYKAKNYKNGDWDKAIPDDAYFKELFRVSKNQVIWGGNYFPLPPTQCFIFWYKRNPVTNFSDGEYAWTSFRKPALCFDYKYFGNIQGNSTAEKKIHPTQKPVSLYEFILKKLAISGDKILDTHLGSGSIALACHNNGFDLTACEKDEDYYLATMQRIQLHQRKLNLF